MPLIELFALWSTSFSAEKSNLPQGRPHAADDPEEPNPKRRVPRHV
jgi:hypothetical protein